MPQTLMPEDPSPESLLLDGPPPPWPDWLEGARIDDAVVDAAYEATPPQLRSCIKTGLALAFAHFGQYQQETDSMIRQPRAGFWFGARIRPVPWCLIVLDASYAAAARLTAACVLPRLCNVPEVFAVAVGDGKAMPADNVLTALTLSGVEDVFCLRQADASKLLEDMAGASASGPQGRVVLLHGGALDDLARTARHCRIPCYEENGAPDITVLSDSTCDSALLAFAHGKVAPATELTPTTQAVFAPAPTPGSEQEYAGNPQVAEALRRGLLVVSPGCEGWWLHPGLEPAFFATRGLVTGFL